MTFDEAFAALIGNEGGYVNNPSDPGGETKFGISKRAFHLEDIKAMTLARAKTLYAEHYWQPAGCDQVPEAIRFDLFDMAVNSGPVAAIRCLQGAAGADPDGVIGPKTIAAAAAMDGARLFARFNGARLRMMTDLKTWPVFGCGWARRIASNLMRV